MAAGLSGKSFSPYPLNAWSRAALIVLGWLPQAIGRFVITRAEPFTALPQETLENLTAEELVEARLQDYHHLEGSYPAIVVGTALGGASAFLSLALHAPFLPQTFVSTLKGGSQDGGVRVYYRRSAELALKIARQNPGIITIQHYDPIHDEWMTRRVNHLRFKLLDLPQAYLQFIRRTLVANGTIVFLDCEAQWLRYRVGERSFFHVCGWGDISPEEFLQGSPRIQEFARRVGLTHTDWRLPEFPLETGPESEWGSEPRLVDAVQAFCRQEGYRFVHICLPQPHDFSRLAFLAMRRLLETENRSTSGVLIEMFSQFDPFAALQSGLLPLWLVYNTRDSLAFLEQMRSQFPSDKPVFFSPLSTFSQTPDLVPWQQWVNCLAGFDLRNIGTRPSHYPSDTHTLVYWNRTLWRWVRQRGKPLQNRLNPTQLEECYHSVLRAISA